MQTILPGTENLNAVDNPGAGDIGAHPNPQSYFLNDSPGVQLAIPMPPGFAHGPLWSVDPETGEPTYSCIGGIQYTVHRWIIDDKAQANTPLRYSMWTVVEHLPEDVKVPLEMITQWPNAYLQSTMTPADCQHE